MDILAFSDSPLDKWPNCVYMSSLKTYNRLFLHEVTNPLADFLFCNHSQIYLHKNVAYPSEGFLILLTLRYGKKGNQLGFNLGFRFISTECDVELCE